METLIYVALCGFLNRLRGGEPLIPSPRVVSSVLMGVLYAAYTSSILSGVIVAVGFFLWALKGWGLYFAAGHGQWAKGETEIKWIDKIGYYFIPFVQAETHQSNRGRGIICMGIRGGVYSLPLFIGLALVSNPYALAIWPMFFLQGFAYYFAYKFTFNFVRLAEIIWGVCIGLMLAAVHHV